MIDVVHDQEAPECINHPSDDIKINAVWNKDLSLRGDAYNTANSIWSTLCDVKSFDHCTAYLRHLKAVSAGTGMYAEVLCLNGVAVKVSTMGGCGNHGLDWVKAVVNGTMATVLDSSLHSYIPKIYGYVEYIDPYDDEYDFFIAFMEPLTELVFNPYTKDEMFSMAVVPKPVQAVYVIDSMGCDDLEYKSFYASYDNLYGMSSKELTLLARALRRQCCGVNAPTKALVQILHVIQSIITHQQKITTFGDLDLHMGNFMQRANGEIVLTDPIA